MNQNLNLWQQFPETIKKQIEANSVKKTFTKAQFIYLEGETPQGVYFLKKGLVALVAQTDKGSEYFLRFFRAGQFFGHRSFFAEESYHASAVSLSEAETLFLPKEMAWQILKDHPEALLYVVKALATELRMAETQRVDISDKDVMARVGHTMMYLKELDPQRTWTRQEIASFCASTTSTVIKTLAELENRGLIKQEGRQILLVDTEGLLNLQSNKP